MELTELEKAAKCVYLACPESVAEDISSKLLWAVDEITKLRGKVEKPLNKVVAMDTKPECDYCEMCLNDYDFSFCGNCGRALSQ